VSTPRTYTGTSGGRTPRSARSGDEVPITSTYVHDSGSDAATTIVPINAVVTHIAGVAGSAGNMTIDIGTQPQITVSANQPFELPPGALEALHGPVAIQFGGSVALRFVSWRQ